MSISQVSSSQVRVSPYVGGKLTDAANPVALKSEKLPLDNKFYVSITVDPLVMSSNNNVYLPPIAYTEAECTKPTQDPETLIAKYMEVMNVAVALLKGLKLQDMIAKVLGDLSEQTLQLMDDFSKVMSELAQNLSELTKAKEADAAAEALKRTRNSGIIGMVLGLVQMIGAVWMLASGGITGIGAVAALVLFADGLVKFSASVAVTANPESAGGMLSKMMNNGIFAVFDLISNGLGQIVMISFTAIMGLGALLQAGIGLVSNVANLGRNATSIFKAIADGAKSGAKDLWVALKPVTAVVSAVLIVASAIMRLIGLISIIAEQFSNETSQAMSAVSDEKNKIMSNTQALSLGLIGFALFEVVSESGLSNVLKNSMGDLGDMIFEMLIYAAIGLYTDAKLGNWASKLVTLSDDALVNNAVVMKFRDAIQRIGNTTQLMQLASQVQSIIQAIQKKAYEDQNAQMQFLKQITAIEKSIFEEAQQVQNRIYQGTMDKITDIASISNLLGQGIIGLLEQVGASSVTYG